MESAVKIVFPDSRLVTDRFHVVKLSMDALQHMRIKQRWAELDKENTAIEEAKKNKIKYEPKGLENEDTPKQLLARCRYILAKRTSDWTESQKQRASMLINPQPAIPPTADDIVVTKRRFSAFSGSDLEVILRAQNIRHLVLAGIITSGVVLSTVREAADKDYQLTVLSDLCADHDPEVHSLLINKVFPRQAAVMTYEEWNCIQS